MTRYPTIWYLILFYSSFNASAQSPQDVFDYSLSSPYNTIITHLGFLKEGNYYPEIAAEAFSQEYRSQQEAIELAIRLQQLLQENKVNIDLSQVPQDEQYIDSEAKYHRYQLTPIFPEIYLVKVKNKWTYSEETVRNIPVLLVEQSYPLGMKKLQKLLPDGFRKKILGLYLWQYLLFLFFILLVIGVRSAVVYMFEKWFLLFSQYPYRNTLQARLMKGTVSLLITFLVSIWFLPIAQLSATLEQSAIRLLKGATLLTTTALCYQWIHVLAPQTDKKRTKKIRQLNLQLMMLAQPFMKVLVVLVGILLTLKALDFEISNLLTGISIGGIGFALASQDTIKNFFGTLAICIDHPFGVGDTIVTGSIKGKVEEIGLRATRIRTHHQSIIYVPNAKLIDTHVDNYGLQNYQRFDVHIAVAYETKPMLIKAFIEGLEKIKTQHHYIQKNDDHHVYLEGVHDATLKILFFIYLDAQNQVQELQYRHEVLDDIAKLADGLGMHLVSFSPSK